MRLLASPRYATRFFARRAPRGYLYAAAALFCLLCAAAPLQGLCAEHAASAPPVKKAVVLATFGTTYDQQGDPLALVKAEIAKRHPDLRQSVAYTSEHVRKTLHAKGKEAQTLAGALAALSAEGYTHVAVQSLHVTPGLEYELAAETAKRFDNLPKGIRKTVTGRPLIGSHEDADRLSAVLLASLPKERTANDSVIFVGHGAQADSGSLAYPALLAMLRQRDAKTLIGTLEGPFDDSYALAAVKSNASKKVWLVPLLTLVGDHAENDIFGDEKGSWKLLFIQEGITAEPVRQGLFSLPGVAAMFADHLDAALRQLDSAAN